MYAPTGRIYAPCRMLFEHIDHAAYLVVCQPAGDPSLILTMPAILSPSGEAVSRSNPSEPFCVNRQLSSKRHSGEAVDAQPSFFGHWQLGGKSA